MSHEYYDIGPSINDIDFYIGAEIVHVNSFIDSSVSVSGTRVQSASSAIDIQTTQTTVGRKIITAQSEIQIQITSETVPLEILNVLTLIDINLSSSTSASKISLASATASISLQPATLAIKITKASGYSEVTFSVLCTAMKIAKASAVSNPALSTGFHSTLIRLLSQQIDITSQTTINPPIRFSPNYIDETSIRTLLILDGKPLTNHLRKFDISLSPIFIETTNWNNKKNRYYKRSSTSGRKTFNISWSSLPNSMDKTVDLRHGRDYIHSVAEDPDSHELKIINQNESGTTPYTESTYTVFVKEYSETLTRRYISEGVYLYDCNLSLEEV